MSLADLIVNAEVTVAPGLGSARVAEPVTVATWGHDDDGNPTCRVVFGPYVEKLTFDGILVTINAGVPERLQVTEDGGDFTLPAGLEFEYLLTIGAEARQVR